MLRLVVSNVSNVLKSSKQPIFRAMSTADKPSLAEITARTGVDPEIFTKRKVVVYRPARSAMTQGRAQHSRPWKLM